MDEISLECNVLKIRVRYATFGEAFVMLENIRLAGKDEFGGGWAEVVSISIESDICLGISALF